MYDVLHIEILANHCLSVNSSKICNIQCNTSNTM